MKKQMLLIPGPVDVDDEVLAIMGAPVVQHYGKEWAVTYHETVRLCKEMFRTGNDLFILSGPGSAAMDAAIGSLMLPGERLLALVNGFFGERLTHIAREHGLEAVVVEAPPGQPVTAEAVAKKLAQGPKVQAIALVHHETSTGVINPVREVAEVARRNDLPLILDAVSSMGGMALPVDEWGIDLCITTSNKCLEIPPGLAPISVSERAWQIMDAKDTHPGWYLNLRTWREYAANWGSWHPHPTTLPSNSVLALHASLVKIMGEGLERRYAHYACIAQAVRTGLRALGFEMFVQDEYASPLTTAALSHSELPANELQEFLREEHCIFIGAGIGPLAGKIFRVGHMGASASWEGTLTFLFAVEDCMRRRGLKVAPGQSLAGLAT
jgi:alanine-glyoxylate transaminase/serine-glyoxylate transaminase/serine-pyruvate transaminase